MLSPDSRTVNIGFLSFNPSTPRYFYFDTPNGPRQSCFLRPHKTPCIHQCNLGDTSVINGLGHFISFCQQHFIAHSQYNHGSDLPKPHYGILVVEWPLCEHREMIMVERKRRVAVYFLWELLRWRGFHHAAVFHQSKQGENSLEFCIEEINMGRKEGRVSSNQKPN